jgi:flagellar biosynthesis component FlhA
MLTWSWIIQIIIISIILIFLIHYLVNFFTSVLTVPKIKDLIHRPKQKYKDIYDVISANEIIDNNINNNIKYNLEEIIPTNNLPNMKTELKNFIKKQLNENSLDSSTNIQSLQSTIDNNFSFL